MIHNYGLLWRRDRIYWGKGGKGDNSAHLRGMPTRSKKKPPDTKKEETVDFRKQIGVYGLYHDFELVYVGQVGAKTEKGEEGTNFHTRLNCHRTDFLEDRWNRFSWFGIRKVRMNGRLGAITGGATPTKADILDTLEAVMISISEPKLNRKGGKWKIAKEYFQWWSAEEVGDRSE